MAADPRDPDQETSERDEARRKSGVERSSDEVRGRRTEEEADARVEEAKADGELGPEPRGHDA